MKKIKDAIEDTMLIALAIATLFMLVEFFRFPECYVDSWRDELEEEIKSGNAEMIEFYNSRYVENGRILFE